MAKRATMKDIANAAGVSAATVSYILNNKADKSISAETRSNVLSIAKSMNYIPNTAAQRLKTNRANCIAVHLSQTLMLPRYHSILQGLRNYLTPRGYNILLVNDQDCGSFSGCVYAYLSGQADGIIYISSDGKGLSDSELTQIEKEGIPLSVIDCMGENAKVSSITYDYYASSSLRAEYLLQQGFRKILYLCPAYLDPKEIAREQGAKSIAVMHADVSVDVLTIQTLDETWKASIRSEQFIDIFNHKVVRETAQILETVPPDTAILAYSRELQEAVMRILLRQHLTSNNSATDAWYKRGVSFHFPHYEAGVEAACSLINAINGAAEPRRLSLRPIIDLIDPLLF